ncbi:E3 sumo-protein ligase 2-like protein [Favolaschia claudopus]|uniref:E3 sumo-protein ligase 2-like protein n=1 Tax=Favolaschia claudopus TaxID=2862362 RepID=A0AAW0BYT7_9AGAR
MSAIRRPQRSAARSAASLPYARPRQAPAKKSPWSIASGLLSFFNPLRLRSASPSPLDVEDDDGEEEDQSGSAMTEDESPPESLSLRGRQMAHNLTVPRMESPPPQNFLISESASPDKNIQTVVSFLEDRRGQTITPLEAEGLISLLNKSTPAEKPEPFRFSSSVPSTPTRGNSPANDIFNLGASTSTNGTTGSPRKIMTKNPNGPMRWNGAGSARPTKNRYASPSFGASPRATSPRMVFQESPTKPSSDVSPKRRRLETPVAATPPPVPRSSAPGPSPTRVAASQSLPFPHSSTPASSPVAGQSITPVTPNTLLKKTMPVHPSPLRQAWGGSPASSISSGHSSPAQGTPTKAATLLTALIRDAEAEAPKRSLDVRNPYQSASPVSTRVTNTHPPEGATRKRTRVNGRAPSAKDLQKEKNAKEKEEREKKAKETVVPPQAIIEANLPKGSRRSRPPAHFSSSVGQPSLAPPSKPAPRRSPRLDPKSVELEEDEEKDEEEREAGAPATKRARLQNGTPSMVNGIGSPKDVPTLNGNTNASAPAASSTSFAFPTSIFSNGISGSTSGSPPASSPSSSASTNGVGLNGGAFGFQSGPKPLATAPKVQSKLRYSFQPPPTPPPVADKPAEKKVLFPMDPPPVPPSKASFPSISAPSTSAASSSSASAKLDAIKAAVAALPISALPVYTFDDVTNIPSTSSLDPADLKAREYARKLDPSMLPTFDFSASFLPSVKGKEKETAPVQGFNWTAAGAKPPNPSSSSGAWTCGMCMLQNGPDALEKCTVCEAKRPDAPKSVAPVVAGFNWAAAGAKPPAPGGAAGSWTCGMCMLLNGPEVKDKCGVCEAPR